MSDQFSPTKHDGTTHLDSHEAMEMLTHRRLHFKKSLEADISPRMSSLKMNAVLQRKLTKQTDLGSAGVTDTAPESQRFSKLRTFPTSLT